jgi:hypothetical protein
VRLEDKSLEARDRVDNEQAELLEQADVGKQGEDRFRTRATDGDRTPDDFVDVQQAAPAQREEMLATMRAIMKQHEASGNSQHIELPHLLDPLHLRALEMFRAAVEGHRPADSTFVYAADRRMMLEQSLAALQPVLASGDINRIDHSAIAIGSEFQQLVGYVNDFRVELEQLEATQEEFIVTSIEAKPKGEDDDDDEDENADDADDADEEVDTDTVTKAEP